jgi:hypothetical protein
VSRTPNATGTPAPLVVDGWALDGDARAWAPLANATIDIEGLDCETPPVVDATGRFQATCNVDRTSAFTVQAVAAGFHTLRRPYAYDENERFQAAIRLPLERVAAPASSPVFLPFAHR